MTGLNWTRNKATTRAREAARAAKDDWFNVQRLERQLTAPRIRRQRKLRKAIEAEKKREIRIDRLRRLWTKVQDHRWDLE